MKRRQALFTGLALILVTAGLWFGGHGVYIQAKAVLAQYLLQQAWAKTLHGEHQVKPWPWADTWPVARLTVPSRGVDLIVLAGASGRTLAFGPGHLDGSAAPGEGGTSILSGHRDTHFRFLKDLQPGDALIVQRPDGRKRVYRMNNGEVVDARHASLRVAPEEAQMTLVTCYPFDALVPGGPLRYVVHADAEALPQDRDPGRSSRL